MNTNNALGFESLVPHPCEWFFGEHDGILLTDFS